MSYVPEPHVLIGKRITAVHLSDDKEHICFDIEGGESIIASCYGDCCSSTWIENVEGPERLLGVVRAVEGLRMPTPDGYNEDGSRKPDEGEEDYYCSTYVQFYGLKISTDKGDCVLDYRNSSNGYYGGSLSWPDEYNHYPPDEKTVWNVLALGR